MSKRRRDRSDSDLPPKRIRTVDLRSVDRLSGLSNELLLHILSFLSVSSLNICQRLSHRFHALGGDSELWKRQYYSQWVQPRARRLANSKRTTLPARADYSPRVANWFDHGHLEQEGNWKRQYRLRHNWSRGLCRVTEVEFPEPPCPPTLVRFCAGIVFTVDSACGLRAWTANDPASCLASVSLSTRPNSPVNPTALAVSQSYGNIVISVGTENGHLSLFLLDPQTSKLALQSSYAACNGAITAMAMSTSYLLVVSQYTNLILYDMHHGSHQKWQYSGAATPRQLASLKADNILAPMTLSLRVSQSDIIATVVYSFFHIGCGWSIGIQELRLNKDGQQLDSRLATTVDSQYGVRPSRGSQPSKRHSAEPGQSQSTPGAPFILHQQPPTSLSYSHPYLLTSHADNTLTMYLVVSTADDLFVQGGRRLWGHTSSVSAVQVTKRGKAVSVSSRGDEIRIWELETAISSLGTRKAPKEEHGIQLSAGSKHEPAPALPRTLSESLNSKSQETSPLSIMQDCVGFDEERVLLLREKGVGTQLLECYDFT